MPNVFAEFDATVQTVTTELHSRLVASGEWAAVGAAPSTTLTTAVTTSAAQTLAVTSSADFATGGMVVIGSGTTTDYRTITSIPSGTGIAVSAGIGTFTQPIGTTVRALRALRSTTARGAALIVDLADAIPTSARLQLAAYRSHSGPVGGGVDKAIRYLPWRASGGAVTDPVHVVLSAGRDHLFIALEGPRSGEPNGPAGTGSSRHAFAVCDVLPYFANDTAAVVGLIGSSVTTTDVVDNVMHVSRNRGDNASWVTAVACSIVAPIATGSTTANAAVVQSPPWVRAVSDNNAYVWPYVVIESADGLRGRLGAFYYAGHNMAINRSSSYATGGTRVTVGGSPFVLVAPYKGTSTANGSGFGVGSSNESTSASPLVAVPAV